MIVFMGQKLFDTRRLRVWESVGSVTAVSAHRLTLAPQKGAHVILNRNLMSIIITS